LETFVFISNNKEMDDKEIERLRKKIKQYDDRIAVHVRSIKVLAMEQNHVQRKLRKKLQKQKVE